MRGGITSFICSSCLIAAGCTTTAPRTADVKIRPIPDAAAKLRTGSGVLAEANGQLALGNVGLALEGFRKALREQPNSPEAYAGIAKCYEAMGRYDLARSNYEAALALTPKDPGLLTAVAVAFDQQGQTSAAQEAREDAAAVGPAPAPPLPAPRVDSTARAALGSSITVQLPAARPADMVTAVTSKMTADLSPPTPAMQRIAAAPEVTLPKPRTGQQADVALGSTQGVQSAFASSAGVLTALASNVPLDLSPPEPVSVQRMAPAPEVSLPKPQTDQRAAVALGPTRGVQSSFASSAGLLRALASSLGVELPQPGPQRRPDREDQAVATAADAGRGPYLERLSPGEVALVTDGRPAWRAQLVAQTRTSTTVRWVPIMTAEARPNIQILNAAQHQGLAAKTRTVLLDRGWRKIQIGNAADVRERSVVIYPASRRTLGRSLAAQFGFPSQLQGESGVLVVLLGRDAARPVASATRG
jgi:hypothetical protein